MATSSYAPGGVSYFTVPDGITVVRYRLQGGGGTAVPSSEIGADPVQDGGKAAVVEGYLSVTPGEQLWLAAGPTGSQYGVENGAGFGRGGARGGGASTILGRGTPVGLPTAVVVAGGGGGGGEDGTGGNGGGIGGRGSGNAGVGLGGGQDPTYTSDTGENATADGTGGGGGGVVGGRAGQLVTDRRGGGGGGSSRVPSGATVSSTGTGPGSVQLTYGLAPLAPTLISPSAGEVVATGRAVPVQHQFNGSGGGDVQTSASGTYTTPAGSGTLTYSGETTVATIPAALAGLAGQVTWAVRTKGQGGAEGPETTGSFTLAVAPAAPVLANPGPSSTPQQTVTWTADGQAAYRLRVTNSDASTIYSDVTVANSGARSAVVTYPSDGQSYTLRLSVRGASGAWSEEDTESVSVAWTRPATPTIAVSSDPENGALRVDVVHPTVAGRPAVVSSDFTAVVISGPDRGKREQILVRADPDGVTRWRNPASGVEYAIAVTDRDALGVPAVGVSPAPAAGYGRSLYGAAPYGR